MKKAAIEAVQAKGHRTRQIILDAAEELFGETDYDAVSLRDIAEKAHVLLGQVSYHFTNKTSLFEAVAARRADEINRIGIDELKRYQNPSLEQIVDAFVRPVLLRKSESQWNSYVRIMAQVYYQERWEPMRERLFGPFVRTFLRALKQVMPGTPTDVIRQGLAYAVMVLLGASVVTLTRPNKNGSSVAQSELILQFLTGGVCALGRAPSSLPGQPGSVAQTRRQGRLRAEKPPVRSHR